MIEIDEGNPPQKFDLSSQELLHVLARVPNLKFGAMDLIFIKGLIAHHVKSDIDLQAKDDKIRVTLYQPTDEDIKLLTPPPPWVTLNKTPQ